MGKGVIDNRNCHYFALYIKGRQRLEGRNFEGFERASNDYAHLMACWMKEDGIEKYIIKNGKKDDENSPDGRIDCPKIQASKLSYFTEKLEEKLQDKSVAFS